MLQDVLIAIVDGALGILPEETNRIVLLLGICSDGTPNTIYAINSSATLARLGFGPLAESVQLLLDLAGGPCYAMPLTQGVAGSNTPVTQPTGPFGAPPVVGVTGEPFDAYDARVLILQGGALGTATFQVSLDGGATFAPEVLTSASFPVPNTGLTLSFGPGLYNLGDTYRFLSTAPYYSTTDINAAFTAALSDPREWGLVYVVGSPGGATDAAKAAACAGIAAAVGTKMNAAQVKYRFARAILEAPVVTDEMALVTAFVAVAEPRVAVVAGTGKVLSPLTGRLHSVNIARVAVPRLARKPIGKDPSQLEPGDGTGPLPSALVSLDRDEFMTPALDGGRFVTARTYFGRTGFYLTNFPLMSPKGSDYKYLQDGQVIDAACKVARNTLLGFLSKDLDLNANGTLDPGQAGAIDTDVESDLRAALVQPRHATSISFRADRTLDVEKTETLSGSLRVKRKFYPKWIKVDVGFARKSATAPT